VLPARSLSGLSRLPASAPAAPPAAGPERRLAGLSRLSAQQGRPVQPEPVVPSDAGALPLGKGMWLYATDAVEGGNVDAVVHRARHVGLTHIYVRTGSSKMGFYAQPYLDQILEKAHASGLRVIGWDFPYLHDVGGDVARAMAAITYTTPTGHRIDGFAADIETPSEGTNLTPEGAAAYGQLLREAAGPRYPLVAVVPRPSPVMQQRFPYAEVLPPFDAVAPMTYWLNRQPDTDVVNDVTFLAPFGKPVIPVGQAYDGAPEGGRPGPPPPEEIARFLAAAEASGAVGASFWSWQHASQAIWDTIAAAPQFRWEALPPGELRPEQVRALQAQLTSLGHPVAATGAWDGATSQALAAYQERARLPQTGVLDAATLDILLRPFSPPVGPVA
ncbi:MAG: peptidoglycan-binding protein, partial [Actinomycetota bacterium]|nr:peptidoglycan-binding protein [Actinomycetota bacterium]